MIMKKGNEVHLYHSDTGVYIKTYSSNTQFERENGLYRGAIREYLNGRRKTFPLLISTARYDIHPDIAGLPATDIESPPSPSMAIANTLSEDELRRKHDMFFMIYTFVKNIPDSRFVEESGMLRQLGLLGKPRYREALSRPELKEYKGRVDGVTYYGTQASVRKLKQEGVLQ